VLGGVRAHVNSRHKASRIATLQTWSLQSVSYDTYVSCRLVVTFSHVHLQSA